MRQQKEEDYLSGNLTAMIDVVFQLIIFFVCTISMQEQSLSTEIELAMAPNGKAEEKQIAGQITIDVNRKGQISIARTRVSYSDLLSILKKAVADARGVQLPIIIRGDANARHEGIKAVMDACATAGIYKIKFAALKERGS
jgi:biopolymer transport protein ExbD